MAWKIIDTDDILGKLTGPEVTAISTVALGAGQSNPVDDAADRVAQEVRGYVGACPRNIPMGVEPTIPSELMDAALAIIVHRISSRLPAKVLMTDERVHAKDDAIQLLRDVARCNFAIVRPDVASDENVGAVYGSLDTSRVRQFRDQNGV